MVIDTVYIINVKLEVLGSQTFFCYNAFNSGIDAYQNIFVLYINYNL